MVAGRLQEKNGFYYIVLSYTDSAGKRRQPWIGTGLPVKGNKNAPKNAGRNAKEFYDSQVSGVRTQPRYGIQRLYAVLAENDANRCNGDYLLVLLLQCGKAHHSLLEPLGVTLAGLQPRQIQSFYLHEAETLKNTSILRFHANLHKALKYAVRIDLIASNPVDKVDRPKPQAFMASYYSAEEMEKLFEAAQGHKLELIIQLAAF